LLNNSFFGEIFIILWIFLQNFIQKYEFYSERPKVKMKIFRGTKSWIIFLEGLKQKINIFIEIKNIFNPKSNVLRFLVRMCCPTVLLFLVQYCRWTPVLSSWPKRGPTTYVRSLPVNGFIRHIAPAWGGHNKIMDEHTLQGDIIVAVNET